MLLVFFNYGSIKIRHGLNFARKIPLSLKFVKKTNNPDIHIPFCRVGSNAGKLYKKIINKNRNSHYFIKFLEYEKVDKIINKCKLNKVYI